MQLILRRKFVNLCGECGVNQVLRYHHFSWMYAYRFSRVSFSVQTANVADNQAALQHLRVISEVASRRGDRAVFHLSSLFEVLVHLRSSAPDAIDHAQTAMAAAWSNQLDEESSVPQLVVLSHILGIVTSLTKTTNDEVQRKLQALQMKMEQLRVDARWNLADDKIVLPINPTPQGNVSRDTRAILDVDAQGRHLLNISWLTKAHTFSVAYFISGICHRSSDPVKAEKYFKETIKLSFSKQYTVREKSCANIQLR
jgi:hypothetical protein